jgi:hypothetical protein
MEPKDIQAQRDLSISINFGIIFFAFAVANAWMLQLGSSGDLGTAQKTAVTVFVIAVNFMVLLGFDNAVQSWKAVSEDYGSDDSKWAALQQKGPYGVFRVVVTVVPLAVAVTQIIAIYS